MLLPQALASKQTFVDLHDRATSSAESGSQDTRQSDLLLNLFLALQLTSLAGLLIIFATVLLSSRITKRHPIWINFILSWIVSCSSYSFMVGHSTTWQPPHALCFVQAALVYTVPSLTAGATFALLAHVLIFFRVTFSFPEATSPRAAWYILLIAVPYIPAMGMLCLSLGIGIKDPGTVKRNEDGMYCNMRNEYPGKISAVLVTVFMLGCVALEVFIFQNLRKNWDAIRNEVFAHMKGTVIRIFIFSISTIIAASLGVLFFFTENHGPALNIIIALIPLNATLVFGSQEDIIRSWIAGARHIGDLFRCHSEDDQPFSPSQERMIDMTTWSSRTQTVTHSNHTRTSHLSATSL